MADRTQLTRRNESPRPFRKWLLLGLFLAQPVFGGWETCLASFARLSETQGRRGIPSDFLDRFPEYAKLVPILTGGNVAWLHSPQGFAFFISFGHGGRNGILSLDLESDRTVARITSNDTRDTAKPGEQGLGVGGRTNRLFEGLRQEIQSRAETEGVSPHLKQLLLTLQNQKEIVIPRGQATIDFIESFGSALTLEKPGRPSIY